MSVLKLNVWIVKVCEEFGLDAMLGCFPTGVSGSLM